MSSACHGNRGCLRDFSKSSASPFFFTSGGRDCTTSPVWDISPWQGCSALPQPTAICYTSLSPGGPFSLVSLYSEKSLSPLTQRSTTVTVRPSRVSMPAVKEKRWSQKSALPSAPPLIHWVFPGQTQAFLLWGKECVPIVLGVDSWAKASASVIPPIHCLKHDCERIQKRKATSFSFSMHTLVATTAVPSLRSRVSPK